jgi:uroporphyrinogen decarboxylase
LALFCYIGEQIRGEPSMTPRERILAALDRKAADRTPVDLWHTPEVGAALRKHTRTQTDLEMYQALGLDKIVWVFASYKFASGDVSGSQVGAQPSVQRTMWGAPLKGMTAGSAHYDEVAHAPMADYESPSQVERYPYWPDPERFDYDAALREAKEATAAGFAVIGPWVSFFEIYCQLRGLEQSLMDLALNEPLVEAVLDRVEAIQTEMMKRFLPLLAGHLDLAFISDDVGSQTGLLMSPAMWRRHLEKRMRRWCDLVHAHGVKVFFHTDGAAEPLIGPLIDTGIDVLNPIQHLCPGMETAGLKKKYGRQLIFHGGVDNQHALPFGSPDDVRAEVRMLKDTLGAGGGGFICASCHNVQAGTPVANILAMIEAAKE